MGFKETWRLRVKRGNVQERRLYSVAKHVKIFILMHMIMIGVA